MIQIREEYKNAKKYMNDYRMNLLSSLIEKKLGLTKKNTKAESFINGFIYDIAKEQS